MKELLETHIMSGCTKGHQNITNKQINHARTQSSTVEPLRNTTLYTSHSLRIGSHLDTRACVVLNHDNANAMHCSTKVELLSILAEQCIALCDR